MIRLGEGHCNSSCVDRKKVLYYESSETESRDW